MSGFGGRKWLALAVSVAILCAAGYWWLAPRRPLPPLPQSAYVWQRAWTPAVERAVTERASDFGAFYVLAGEVYAAEGGFTCGGVPVSWDVLAKSGAPLWPTLRMNSEIARALREQPQAIAAFITDSLRAILDAARGANAGIAGVQLDLDCPSEALRLYAAMIEAIRPDLAGTRLSVTALPTWLSCRDFAAVAGAVDHFTLQVHGLEKPDNQADRVSLCEMERVPEWLRLAEAFHRPFSLALATYGYRLYFDDSGEFTGLGAEGSPGFGAGQESRLLAADPVATARLVRELNAARPAHLCEITWFRLPVEGDTLNWPWPTLDAVMAGRTPEYHATAEVRRVRPDLYEVWARSAQDAPPGLSLRIPLEWNAATVRAHDCFGGFRVEGADPGAPDWLVGPVPYVGPDILVAWFVVSGETLEQSDVLKTGHLEIGL